MESKIVNFIEAENMMVARDRRKGKIGKCWSKGTRFQLYTMNEFWRSHVQHGDYS